MDTAFVAALLDPKDGLHEIAAELLQEIHQADCGFLSTDAVLIEIANYFSRSWLREEAIEWVLEARRRDIWEILPLYPSLLSAGETRYRRYRDKQWSLTDCISMEAMKRRRINDVATADDHFTQAGFRVLL